MIVRLYPPTLAPATVLLVVLTCLTTVTAQKKPVGQTTPARGGALDAKEIARRVLPSVVLLECDNTPRCPKRSGATEKVTEASARITLFVDEKKSRTIKSINIRVQGHTIKIVISDVGRGAPRHPD